MSISFQKDRDVQELVQKTHPVTLDEVLRVARERGIKEPARLWELFDWIQARWKEHRLPG